MVVHSIKLIISMAIFGSIGFFTIQTGIPAIELVFVRCICATVFLIGIWALIGGAKKEQWNKQDIIRTAICGIFLVLNWVFLFKAFEAMSISIAISIYNLAPIFVLLFGSIWLKERLTWQNLTAVIICFIGSILIIGLQQMTSLDAWLSNGVLWAFLSAICYAATMLTSRTIQKLSSYSVTFIQTTVGIVMLWPFCDFTVFDGLTTTNWLFILATGLVHTGVVYILFFESVRYLPAIVVSVLVFVDPVVAILLDMVILSFIPSVQQWLGIALIFGAILYVALRPNGVQT